MAQDILGLHLYNMENEDSNFPPPSPIDQMMCKPNQKIFLIKVHMPSVRKEITEQLYQQRSKIMQFIDETFGKSKSRRITTTGILALVILPANYPE